MDFEEITKPEETDENDVTEEMEIEVWRTNWLWRRKPSLLPPPPPSPTLPPAIELTYNSSILIRAKASTSLFNGQFYESGSNLPSCAGSVQI